MPPAPLPSPPVQPQVSEDTHIVDLPQAVAEGEEVSFEIVYDGMQLAGSTFKDLLNITISAGSRDVDFSVMELENRLQVINLC